MLLRKHLSLSECDIKLDGDSGRFAGYASVFGGVDSYGDTIVRGAFASSLTRNGKPKMFFQHDWHMPIGKWLVAREDDKGLWVEGELTKGLSLADDVAAALRHGTLDGLSIGGFVKKGDYDETEGGRVIRRWDKLVEVSPVVFPADAAARIDAGSVKGIDILDALDECERLSEIEQLLRDAAGLSKRAAAALVARVKAVTAQGEPTGDEAAAMKALHDRIARLSM
jgi:HK97 family phage prohead protease